MNDEYWKNKKGFFKDGRKLRILACRSNDGGCSYYRLICPMTKLQELYPDVVEIRHTNNPLDWSLERKREGKPVEDLDNQHEDFKWADIVFLQNISNFGGPYSWRIEGIAKDNNCKVHFDSDDLLTELYPGHRLEEVYRAKNLGEITKQLYYNADLVTVTQEKFAERIEPYCTGELAIIRNAIDYNLPAWNMPKTKVKKQVRVGWAGGIHHEEDLKEFVGIPNLVNQKVGKEKLNWQFWGCPPKKDGKKDWQHEVWDNYHKMFARGFKGSRNYGVYNALPTDRYGMMFANFDVAIAPLQMNNFNDSKCFRPNQKLLDYKGSLVKVKDICEGDLLMGVDSLPRKVTSTYNGRGQMVKISPKRGKDFYVTENHILRLKTNDAQTLKTRPQYLEVSVKEYLSLPKSTRTNYRLYKTGVEFEGKSLEIEPYFIGALLGDGSISRGMVGITSMDQEIVDYYTEYSLSLGEGLVVREDKKVLPSGEISRASTYRTVKSKRNNHIKNPVIEKLRGIGVYGYSCKDKFITNEYKVSSRQDRLQLLAGLIDTDGCCASTNNVFAFSNSSLQLVEDTAFVARSLGLYVSPVKEFIINERSYWNIRITGDIDMIPTKLKRKQGAKRLCNRDPLTTSFSVEYLQEEDCVGIQVDGDGLVIMDDFTVTHNSDIKVAECLKYSIPLIASNVGCYEDTIKNGVTGYLIEPGAPKTEWVRVLTRVAKDKKHREEMGKNINALQDHFDINKVVYNRLTLYSELFPDEFTDQDN